MTDHSPAAWRLCEVNLPSNPDGTRPECRQCDQGCACRDAAERLFQIEARLYANAEWWTGKPLGYTTLRGGGGASFLLYR